MTLYCLCRSNQNRTCDSGSQSVSVDELYEKSRTRNYLPLTFTGRKASKFFWYIWISGPCRRRWMLCSYYTSEMWKRNGPKL